MAVIVTPELCCEIKGVKSGSIDTIYADIPEEHLNETILDVMAKHRNYAFMNSTGIEAQDALNNMLSIYYLIFAVVFLMVCFIIVSMSKHIVNERMSVVGMLRIAAGRHFPTDVAVGALAGAGISLAVIKIHKKSVRIGPVSLAGVWAGPEGASLAFVF